VIKKSRIRVTPTSNARSWSRREVLARGAGAASVLALPQFWIPKAWGQTATFDYYISTTGNDNNPGTLAAPWALTSFIQGSTNNNAMAGKRIGIIAGNYSIDSRFPEMASNWTYCKLNLPNGTASNPTYVASCDTSGNYSPRVATITWAGASTTSNAMIGGASGTPASYITIDGLRINANGVGAYQANCGHIIQFYGGPGYSPTSSNGASGYTGITVQNCELWNIDPYNNGGSSGGNYGAIFVRAVSNCLIQNNLIHDVIVSNGGSSSHTAGILELGCFGNIYQYNTIYNCAAGIWSKEGNTGSIACYNYFYNIATSSAALNDTCSALNVFSGITGDANTGPSPLTQQLHHNIFDACGPSILNPAPGYTWLPVNIYNNTTYDTITTGHTGYSAATNGCVAEVYNNIYVTTNGSSGAGSNQTGKIVLTASAGAFSNVDYNAYYSANGSYTQFWGAWVGTQYSTFASWKAAMQAIVAGTESHSLNANPNFAFPGGYVAGGGAAQFRLASGSPCLGTGQGGNMGAWDGTVTQIGCNFATGSAGSTNAVPVAPKLTVS
jgi:hypothetical protein